MPKLILKDTEITDAALNAIAHLPTKSLASVVVPAFFKKLEDKDFGYNIFIKKFMYFRLRISRKNQT